MGVQPFPSMNQEESEVIVGIAARAYFSDSIHDFIEVFI
jgi:hypothetical protein